ncbi:hypothetical protein [Streptomyces sp. NPDC059862]|uniref:hypothetical protein n=1 Tax=unclassified Streptomyces TaxID=2593676 RepID=UPI00363A2057
MARYRTRWWAVGAVLVVAVGAGLTGCTDNNDTEPLPTDAASAVESAASQASDFWASATAEAERRIDEITKGIDVRDDVTLGRPTTADDGRTTVEVTARNTTDSTKSFIVQVDFNNRDGDFLDTVVVTVSDVRAGRSGEATARSTHRLSGDVEVEVARAVRY